MIKRFKRHQQTKRFYRTNERIFAATIRVLDSNGKQIGILSKYEALKKAQELGVDLVEIAPKANPPVAKLVDFKKFLYQEEKKKREEKRKAKVSETKEIRLGPFISENDLHVMIRRGLEFLEDGDKVRLVVRFRGRQITHPEFGREVINKFFAGVCQTAKFDKEAHMEGRQMVAIVSPEKKGAKKHEENQEISSETLQGDQNRQSTV